LTEGGVKTAVAASASEAATTFGAVAHASAQAGSPACDAAAAASVSEAAPACPECGTAFVGDYCQRCGEKRPEARDLSVRHFLADAAKELTSLDSKLLRTVWALLFRPGC
jgi:predicted amidophosphoribosyltransferase